MTWAPIGKPWLVPIGNAVAGQPSAVAKVMKFA
jgi:hypothetical protein